ncbi:hypothetical protein [Kibdelosporangium philippinense]|uniref:hypothetical protein n=1 Tax=Kibdelosporangium philippinense TaxID=211113 RepID=UPI00360FEA65
MLGRLWLCRGLGLSVRRPRLLGVRVSNLAVGWLAVNLVVRYRTSRLISMSHTYWPNAHLVDTITGMSGSGSVR